MRSVVAMLGLLVLPAAVCAHHSTADYDTSTVLELEGELVETRWGNPHVVFTLRVRDQNGEFQDWELASEAVYVLERTGLDQSTFPIDERVRVAGWRSNSRPLAFYITNMLLSSGAEVVLGGASGSRWSDDYSGGQWISETVNSGRRDVFRVWSAESLNVFVEAGQGIDVELTEPAQAQMASTPELDPCVPQGMPGIMVNPLPIEFIDRGDHIDLQIAGFAILRRIDMTSNPDVDSLPATKYGHSAGRWVGDMLEVRTTRVSWPYFDDAGRPQTEDAETLEQFSLAAEGTRLEYTMTVTDPASFTEPVTLSWYWIDIGEEMFLADLCPGAN